MKYISTITTTFMLLLLAVQPLVAQEQAKNSELSALNQEVQKLYGAGKYDRAVVVAKKALEIAEKTVDSDHPVLATALSNLSGLYLAQGLFEEAEPLLKRTLEIREKTLGLDHPDVAISLNNLGVLYDRQGQYTQAEMFYKRALVTREKALGPDHPDVVTSMMNLGVLYYKQGQYAQAEPLYKRILEIREKTLGPGHSDVAISLDNLAHTHLNQGQYAQAEPLLKRALAIRERALGPDHLQLAMSLDSLAHAHLNQGQYTLADPLYKRAWEIRKKALGPDHPDVAISLKNLHEHYKRQGKYTLANWYLNASRWMINTEPNSQDTGINNKSLLSAFHMRCGELSQLVDMLGFPDKYLNPSVLAACEIAFIIDPERHAEQYYTRLVAQSMTKSESLDADLHEANSILTDQFKIKYQKEPADIDLDFAGHQVSFYNLLVRNISLSSKQRVSMREFIGESITDVLFGRFADPEFEASDSDLTHAVEQTLLNASLMSGYVLNVATKNIHNALTRSYVDQTAAEMYLSMPVQLRKLLFSLASITTDSFDIKELAVMRAIQYSHLERRFYSNIGTQKRFSQAMQEYPETEFIWVSHGISEAQNGGIATWPTIAMLNKLRSLIQRKPYLLENYAKYFPDVDYEAVLAIDTESLRKRYVDAMKSHSLAGLTEHETSLLIADIRHAATHQFRNNDQNSDFYYINTISPENPFVINLLNKQVNPLIELAWKTKLVGEWTDLSTGIEDLIENISTNINTICDPVSEETCDRMWRNIDLSNFSIEKYDSDLSECQISQLMLPILERQLGAGYLDQSLASCSIPSGRGIFNKKSELEWVFVLTRTMGSPLAGSELLQNRFFVMGGGGLIAKHVYNAYEDKRISPVPKKDEFLPDLSGSKSWAHFYEIANNRKPEGKKSDQFSWNIDYQTLATIYSVMANHERALLSQISYVEELGRYRLTSIDSELGRTIASLISLTRLKHYARNAGVPETHIDSLIEKYKPLKIQKISDLVNDSTVTQGVREYFLAFETNQKFLKAGNLSSVYSSLNDLEFDEEFPGFLGRILALKDSDLDLLCADKKFQQLAYSKNGDSEFIRLTNKIRFNTVLSLLYLEIKSVDVRCRLAMLGTINESQPTDQLTANVAILIDNEIINYIRGFGSFTDPRFSKLFVMISQYSQANGSTTGLVASLVALKHSFELMAEAFIFRNSATWRLKMPDIETVIVNTTKALRDVQKDSGKLTAIHSRLMRRAESLAASAHAIFVSDRTRARMLDVENKTYTEVLDDASIKNNTAAYNQMTEYFHTARTSLAESKTISEAIINKARFGEHGVQAIPRFYKAAAQIEKAIASPKEVFPTSNNSVLLNILSNGKNIYFQLLDDKGRYLSDTLDIQASLASRLKERIIRNTRITTDDVKLGCEAFASVHHALKPLIKDYSRIVVVPSVNLLPIPTEIIIGTACDSSDATIIHAADVLGAIELMRSDKNIDLPQSFVGIGNPSLPLESNQIEIAAVDGGSKEIVRNLAAIDQFLPLPDAEEEIQEIATIFDDISIFIAGKASIKKGLDAAQINRQKGKDSAIVLATHGVGLDLGQGFELPSLLSIEDGHPTMIGATAVQQFDLDGAIVVLSACDTAAGLYEKPEMMFTGFVESFADTQSSFIVASLWPVLSQASKQHTVAFFRALENGNIWQAARAGKQALSNAIDGLPFVYIYP